MTDLDREAAQASGNTRIITMKIVAVGGNIQLKYSGILASMSYFEYVFAIKQAFQEADSSPFIESASDLRLTVHSI